WGLHWGGGGGEGIWGALWGRADPTNPSAPQEDQDLRYGAGPQDPIQDQAQRYGAAYQNPIKDQAQRYGAGPQDPIKDQAQRYGAEPQNPIKDQAQRYGAADQDQTHRYGAGPQDQTQRYGAGPQDPISDRYGAGPQDPISTHARRYGAALRSEWREYGDVLQGSFWDTYSNLTQKTLFLLGWAVRFCPTAQFILKADDDTFIHTPALLTHLSTAPQPLYYMGRVHRGVKPNRDPRSRHYVPIGLYPAPLYPPYCSGSAYVLSMGAVRLVLDAAPQIPRVSPEDVYVGLCAYRAGLVPTHMERMGGGARFPEDRCCYGAVLLSAHRVGPDGMRRVVGFMWGYAWEMEGKIHGERRVWSVQG
uniref:Hexosyltransferase n=1 Tax=Coturnix japonica TaxID=93934 RepID=A0A8C2SQ81_COTJA